MNEKELDKQDDNGEPRRLTHYDIWGDKSNVIYSAYYGAQSEKQHRLGTRTQKQFLFLKISMAKKIFELLGGRDDAYLQLLLTVDSLSAAPFGMGGANVLAKEYQYNKNDTTLKIVEELRLSCKDILLRDLDRKNPADTTEASIVKVFDELRIDSCVEVLPRELESFIIENLMSDDQTVIDDYAARNAARVLMPMEREKVLRQEEKMREVIEKYKDKQGLVFCRCGGPPEYVEPLKYFLGTKEGDFGVKL